jgi:hypothetical protein
MKNLRFAAAMLIPAAFIAPTAANADSAASTETAAPKVDAILNSPEAIAEKSASPGASGTSQASLASVKARAAEQIAKRQKTLIEWSGDIAKAKGDCGQNAGSSARITQTQTGLASLAPQIQAAPDLVAAKALSEQIATTYRVYLVVGPVVHISLGCGAQSARSARLLTEAANVETLIATAKAGGADTAAASALVAQVKPLVEQAKNGSAAASNSVASIVPDLGNEATKTANAATLLAARNQIKAADTQLDSAAKALHDARASFSGAKKTERSEDKAEKKSERDAKKAAHEVEKNAKKANRDAAKAERKSKK